jgi:phage baseplate assembly protein W
MLYRDLNQLDPISAPFVDDLDAIHQAVYNWFITIPGERVENLNVGFDRHAILWKPINRANADLLRNMMAVNIVESVGRIIPKKVIVTPVPDKMMYIVEVSYTVPGFSDEVFVFSDSLRISR